MAYTIFRFDELDFRSPSHGNQARGLVPLSEAMKNMRANIWRIPSGVRGRRHLETVQDELFVVLDGTATMALGNPPEMVELARGSVVVVETGTPVQLRNESDAEAVVLIVGAPPVPGNAEYLPDVE
jgi:mannose-6-phosphate isomerase-like protein (cupin superfamily)